MTDKAPDYRCPGCNTESRFIIGPTQAMCSDDDCRVFTFNPSLPDGGLSQARVIDIGQERPIGSTPVGFTCPACQRTSYHPDDIKHGYCGACHAFTGTPAAES